LFSLSTSIHLSDPLHFQADSPTPARWKAFIEPLLGHLPGGAYYSLLTCNRAELYAETPASSLSREQVEQRCRDHFPALPFRLHIGNESVHHLFRVAAGLDSLVPGEVEILGQIRRAREEAEQNGHLSPALDRLVTGALRAARHTREATRLGQGKVSVSSLAVEIAMGHVPDCSSATALVLGAGEAGVLAARILRDRGVGRLIVSNRSLDKARIVAASLKCDVIRREEITTYLAHADIVLTATSAPHPVLRREHIEHARSLAPTRPLILIDLSTPANIARDVLDATDVRLVTLEDIQQLVECNHSLRRARMAEAEALTLDHLNRYLGASGSTVSIASAEPSPLPPPSVADKL
jgi:glutamyl-tRNA reductase